jgi:low affinity Fe/Cu permease
MGSSKEGLLARFAGHMAKWSGTSMAFGIASGIIVVWCVSGPFFGYSDTWQLVINTGTTIVTFLMVFLIQRAQNKDSQAIHLKLNEIVAALEGASNRMINAESMTEEELTVLHNHYCRLIELAKRDESLSASHSVDEADDRHAQKQDWWKTRHRVPNQKGLEH